MNLETERGNFNNPDAEVVKSELGKLNNGDNDHAILSDAGGFLQTATSSGGFLLEYRDGSGYFGSRNEGIPLEQVQEAFALYLAGDGSWKGRFEWVPREEPAGAQGGAPQAGVGAGSAGPASDTAAQPTGATGVDPSNPLDSLVNTVKSEAVRLAKRKLRGLFRR